jgi:hypothetical protein
MVPLVWLHWCWRTLHCQCSRAPRRKDVHADPPQARRTKPDGQRATNRAASHFSPQP